MVQQVEGAFEVKDEKLQRYCEAVEYSKDHFMEMQLKQVPRAENHQEDKLARLVSSLGEWITREIMT